jgi:hypothetical protein
MVGYGKPLGIKIISVILLIFALLAVVSVVAFYKQIWGSEVHFALVTAISINQISVVVGAIFLAYGLNNLMKWGWQLAIAYCFQMIIVSILESLLKGFVLSNLISLLFAIITLYYLNMRNIKNFFVKSKSLGEFLFKRQAVNTENSYFLGDPLYLLISTVLIMLFWAYAMMFWVRSITKSISG